MRRLAYTVAAVAVILGVLALYSRGDDDGDPEAASTVTPALATATPTAAAATPATATPTPTPATATPTPALATSTPTPTPATVTATPTPASTPSATTTTATPTLTPLASVDGTLPSTFLELAAVLPDSGLRLTDAYDPACPGSSVEPIVFAGADSEDGERFAVWVFWPYPDREVFWEEWDITSEGRAEPLLDGCEPPNGYVYFNRGLLIWFVGFYGSDVEPGSPPTSRAEIRQHPVIRAFLGLPR